MGLGDCPKCWDRTCACGYMYEEWPKGRLENLIKKLQEILNGKTY